MYPYLDMPSVLKTMQTPSFAWVILSPWLYWLYRPAAMLLGVRRPTGTFASSLCHLHGLLGGLS